MNGKIVLISNPKSERNKRGMAEIKTLAAGLPDLIHLQLSHDYWLDQALASLNGQEIGLWICNSGDGTVHGLLSRLLREPERWPIPYFAILPRGMANMTAADCGLRKRTATHLQSMLDVYRDGGLDTYVSPRKVLQVDYHDREPAQFGMFFGAAGIYDAIQLCKGEVHQKGFKGEWSHAVTLAQILWTAATRGLATAGIAGRDIRLRIDGGERLDERLLVVLCTTLERLVLRSRPFWNTGDAPFKFTRIADPAQALVRNAWRILYGGEPRRLDEDSYRSCGAQKLELWLNEPFTIDGEFFTPVPTRPVRITATGPVRFVRY